MTENNTTYNPADDAIIRTETHIEWNINKCTLLVTAIQKCTNCTVCTTRNYFTAIETPFNEIYLYEMYVMEIKLIIHNY